MELPGAFGIELEALIDLIRLITSSSPDRPSTIFKWKRESHFYYGSFAIFPGYYDFKALPVLFYVTSEVSFEKEGQGLIRYDLQKEIEEQISYLCFLKEQDLENAHTGLVRFIPIVNLKTPPKIFAELS